MNIFKGLRKFFAINSQTVNVGDTVLIEKYHPYTPGIVEGFVHLGAGPPLAPPFPPTMTCLMYIRRKESMQHIWCNLDRPWWRYGKASPIFESDNLRISHTRIVLSEVNNTPVNLDTGFVSINYSDLIKNIEGCIIKMR